MLRRSLIACCLALPAVSWAASSEPVLNKDYTILATPVQTANPKKIEVISFFAYTCPHCYTYEKALEPWAAKLPADVDYKRVPVAWNDKFYHFSKTYYALEALNKLNPYHDIFFDAVIKEKKEFPDLGSIADYLASKGLNKEEFLKAAQSFAVKMKNDRAFKTWQAYNLDGTPANAVNGKYFTAPFMAGTREGAIDVMNFLIEKERNAKK